MHLSKGIIERDIETTFPDKGNPPRPLLRRRLSLRPCHRQLQKMGYHNVLSLDGGWRAIEASDLPLEPPRK